MFDRFGEFNSVEELNEAAAGLKEEGDEKSLYELAEENGIDKEDVEDYLDGAVPELANALIAAYGKIYVEEKALGAEGIIKDWIDCIVQMCSEDEKLCRAVRKKGKKLADVMGIVLKNGFEIKKKVPDDIVKAAGLNPPIYLGIPNRKAVEDMVKDYYMGK